MTAAPVRLRLGALEPPAFRTLGVGGFAAACVVAFGVAASLDLSIAAQAAIVAAAVATFAGLALTTKALTGRERLVYYHHEIAVLAVAAAVAALLAEPVLGHLDATALGLGAFLVFGRVGCLLTGCCHGRPSRHGIVYGSHHVDAGLPPYLAGERLVPVQALESAAVAALVAGALLAGGRPGTAFSIYVTGYALVRLATEELRGDAVRPYRAGLSEAQWTSLAVLLALAALSAAGAVPGGAWHLAALVIGIAAAAFIRRLPHTAVLAPAHVREIALLMTGSGPAWPATTRAGVRLSCGHASGLRFVTISHGRTPLNPDDAAQLARLIAWLRFGRESARVVQGPVGVFHVISD